MEWVNGDGYKHKSQSLWNRARSFDGNDVYRTYYEGQFQSLWSRAGSFDWRRWYLRGERLFQSLWNRAGSFDIADLLQVERGITVSIPLGQGRVFRLIYSNRRFIMFGCLNPFRTGRGLSTREFRTAIFERNRLNPFGTGQGLSTISKSLTMNQVKSLNPFGTGQGLSTAGVVWCLDGQGLRRSVPTFSLTRKVRCGFD